MYLPNKPKPNCLVLFTAATEVDHPTIPNKKLPFFIDIEPHIKREDGTFDTAARKIVERWSFSTPMHAVLDSGFGSFSLLDFIASKGGTATMSIGSNDAGYLGSMLSYNLPVEKWRAALNDKGYIISTQRKAIEKHGTFGMTQKTIISNAYTAQTMQYGMLNLDDSVEGILIFEILLM